MFEHSQLRTGMVCMALPKAVAIDRGEFELTVTGNADGVTISVHGEVDVYTAPRLRERLLQFETSGTFVVLDIANMSFIDSTGLGVIAAATKRIRSEGGDLVLRQPTNDTRKVLKLTGLDQIVRIERDAASVDGATATVGIRPFSRPRRSL